MKYKKFFKYSSLILFSTLSLSSFTFINNDKSIIHEEKNLNKISLFGGATKEEDKKEPTEEEIKHAKKMFWIEFGVTATFFVLIVAVFISFIVIKKKKKRRL